MKTNIKECGYATVLFIREDEYGKQVLLQKKDRGWRGEDLWTVFGGHIEVNETPIDCIVREVKEELDVSLSLDTLRLFETVQIQSGSIFVPLNLFLAPFTEKISAIKLSEGCGFAFWYLDEVVNLPLLSHERALIEKVITTLQDYPGQGG